MAYERNERFERRDSERIERHIPVKICIGIAAIHEALNQLHFNEHLMKPAMLINESMHGYGILMKENLSEEIKAGDGLGIFFKDEKQSRLEVAMVRWNQYLEELGTKIGILKLSVHPRAVHLKNIHQGKISDSYPCLLFEKSVLTPILPFKTGSQALLFNDHNTEPNEIELTQLIHATHAYKIFDLKFKNRKNIFDDSKVL